MLSSILLEIFISLLLVTLIYGVLVLFKVIYEKHMIVNKYLKALSDNFQKTIDDLNNIQTTYTMMENQDIDDDELYDKTDEELLEDWNNLWGGNPPCELDIKAIREEEKRERERENNKE